MSKRPLKITKAPKIKKIKISKDEKKAIILLKAADEIEAHGWARCTVGLNNGPKCAVGAINYVVTGETKYPLLRMLTPKSHLARVVRNELGEWIRRGSRPNRSIGQWNDDQHRHDQVTTEMRQCAHNLTNE